MTGEEKLSIFLCGFMATGKSSVGKRLAAKMQYQFADMDTLIETETGMTIPQIFASQGEPAFRALECAMVDRIAEWKGYVVATGGGAIVNPQNLEILKRCGVLICLTADVRTILLRSGTGESRPMLHAGDKAERIRQLLQQREPFYAQAHIIVDTSTLTINRVVRRILERLQEFGLSQQHAANGNE
ncbi:MAG: shikimate kinase [Acidobacteria bacterium]|nr:shikimate kinase [Acidobacteriota bacterium]